MKITIIGAGNIGGALAAGLAKSGALPAPDITVTARHTGSLRRFRKMKISTGTDNVTAIKGSDIVFYAVKPWQMEDVIRETAPSLDPARQTVVSVAPGIPADTLKRLFTECCGSTPQIAYVIPNTAAELGQSMTFISPVTASEGTISILKSLLDNVGKTETVPPEKMLAGTAVASCGIAYAMRYISAAGQGAACLGLDEKSIKDVVCQTVRGAAEMVMASEKGAEKEIDRVTTPNGMTIKGLEAMENEGFSRAVVKGLTVRTAKRHRIVIKVGSNVLTRDDGSLDTTRVSSIVDQIAGIRRVGYEVILVTSGAVACGRSLIRQNDKLNDVQQRQLYSAIGQLRLMDLYYKLFIDYGINVGQVLTMKKDFTGKREYGNLRNCMEVMLQSNVIPVVNENDTVSIKELMFTDNDELSGLVAAMMGCETLMILTNVDGIFTGEPGEPGSELIRTIRPSDDFSRFISEEKSGFGRGGMMSKYHSAKEAAAAGTRVIIANGKTDGIIMDTLLHPEEAAFTEFSAD